MKKRGFAIILLGVLLMLSITACSNQAANDKPTNEKSTNEKSANDKPADSAKDLPLSAIQTTDLDGASLSGEDIKGEKLTVINVWATWCPPCVEELPHLQEISEAYKDQGVKIVGVLQDGVDASLKRADTAISQAETLLSNAKADYTIILPDQTINEALIKNMQYFPTTFFIDGEGNIVNTVVGAKNTEQWRSEIDATLKKLS